MNKKQKGELANEIVTLIAVKENLNNSKFDKMFFWIREILVVLNKNSKKETTTISRRLETMALADCMLHLAQMNDLKNKIINNITPLIEANLKGGK